jgi:PAS domain S-box-containing protein
MSDLKQNLRVLYRPSWLHLLMLAALPPALVMLFSGLGLPLVLFVGFLLVAGFIVYRLMAAQGQMEDALRRLRAELEQEHMAGRGRIEAELANERNLLRTLIDTIPAGIYVKDAEGRFTLTNVNHANFMGMTLDGIKGKRDHDFLPADLAQRYYADELAVMQTGQPLINHEEPVQDQQGNLKWASTTKAPLRDPEGNVTGLVGISFDITERKRLEAERAREHNLLRTVIDNLPDLIFAKDRAGRFTLANAACARFVGCATPDELLGKTDLDLEKTEATARYYAQEQALMAAGEPVIDQEELVIVQRTGNQMWVSATKIPLRDADGNVIGLVGISRDITERKQAEASLRESEERYRILTELISDYTFSIGVNPDGTMIHEWATNDSLMCVTGYTPEELIGTGKLFHPEDLESIRQQMVEVLAGRSAHSECRILTKSGELRWLSIRRRPVWDAQENRVLRYYGVAQDITERKLAEQALADERNLLRTVIDTLPDLIYVCNPEGRILMANEAYVRFVGGPSHDAVIGKTDFDFYQADRATRYFAEEQVVMRTGQPIVNQEEFVVGARTGNSMWASATKVPLRDPAGKIIGLVGVRRDISARKKAEQALADERNLLRTVIDNIPDYIYVKDTQGRFVLRNVSGVELLGVASPDEVIGKTDFDFFPEELAREFYDEEQTIIQTGHAILNQEVLVNEPAGIQRWLLYTKVPLRDSQGNIIGIVGVSRDINERKQAEEQLRKLSSAVEQSSSAITITDTQGTIEYLNPQFTRLSGYTAEEALGQKPSLWKSGQVAPEVYQNLWNRILAGGEWRGELLNRRKNGELYWCFTTISAIRDAEGNITHFIALQEDITERKQAEEALKQAHAQLEYERAQLQAILDSMGEGVIYDENLQTRYINQALTHLTGYTIEEWQGYLNPLKSDNMIEEDFQALSQSIYDDITQRGIWRGEVRLRRKDGSEFDAGLTCTEVTGADGNVVGAVTIIRDISAEKALQEQKSRFVANASHELRTPITNLKTRLYLMRKQPEKIDYHLQVIEDVAARMQRLVEDMLDVSRFERGLIPLYQREVVLQQLVSGVVEVQRAEAERKRIRLICELPSEPLHVLADPERMTQVITNLVVNAINYTPEGGSVYVHVTNDEDCAAIHVRDTGVGIAPDQLQQVFQPFFRASQGVSSGTGLGLTIVKDIIERHGGTIEVDSQVGQGSRFSIKLALQNQASTSMTP